MDWKCVECGASSSHLFKNMCVICMDRKIRVLEDSLVKSEAQRDVAVKSMKKVASALYDILPYVNAYSLDAFKDNPDTAEKQEQKSCSNCLYEITDCAEISGGCTKDTLDAWEPMTIDTEDE